MDPVKPALAPLTQQDLEDFAKKLIDDAPIRDEELAALKARGLSERKEVRVSAQGKKKDVTDTPLGNILNGAITRNENTSKGGNREVAKQLESIRDQLGWSPPPPPA
jgi:hypothetical protein